MGRTRTALRCAGIALVLLCLSTSAVRRTDDADAETGTDLGDHQPTESNEIDNNQPASDTNEVLSDDDEFTGTEGDAPPSKESRPEPKVERERRARKPPPEPDHMYEIVVGIIVICYVINYVYGRGVNQQIANAWAEIVLSDKFVCSVRCNSC